MKSFSQKDFDDLSLIARLKQTPKFTEEDVIKLDRITDERVELCRKELKEERERPNPIPDGSMSVAEAHQFLRQMVDELNNLREEEGI